MCLYVFQFRQGSTVVREAGGRTRHTPLLCHATAPEDKRRIIGDVFVRVAEHAVRDLLQLQSVHHRTHTHTYTYVTHAYTHTHTSFKVFVNNEK